MTDEVWDFFINLGLILAGSALIGIATGDPLLAIGIFFLVAGVK